MYIVCLLYHTRLPQPKKICTYCGQCMARLTKKKCTKKCLLMCWWGFWDLPTVLHLHEIDVVFHVERRRQELFNKLILRCATTTNDDVNTTYDLRELT